MSEPQPVYTTQTDDSVELVPAGHAELTLAYRGAVSAALQLQRALHLAPGPGRLWALRPTGEVLAWDLVRRRSLGNWIPRLPDGLGQGFAAAGVCEVEDAQAIRGGARQHPF